MAFQKRLRVRRRPDPSQDSSGSNLFVRFTPSVARELHAEALQAAKRPSEGWEVSSQLSNRCRSGVEFLPLAITLASGSTIYASYNGGDLEQGADDNLIDVPACLLPDDVHEVSVRALSSIESASQLLMEPMTPADWTILEAHADWLEHGGLLQQVSVTSAGQLLTLQCDRHVARVRVADESFGRRAGLWPDDEEDLMCLRLVADTKVIVQPKTNKLPSAVVKIDVGLGDYGQAMQELATRLDIPLVEADQCCAVVHPSTAAEALGPALDDDKLLAVIERTAIASADVRSWTIIRLSTSSFVAQGRIVIHPLTQLDLQVEPLKDSLLLKRLSLEQETALSKLKSLVTRGRIRVGIASVPVEYTRTYPAWRYPTLHATDTPGQLNQTEIEEAMISPPPHLSVAPLRAGALFRLPWHAPAGESQLYRLYLDRDSTNDESILFDDLFLFGRDLLSLLLESSDFSDDDIDAKRNGRTRKVAIERGASFAVRETPCLRRDLLAAGSCILSSLVSVTRPGKPLRSSIVCGDAGSGKTHSALLIAAIAQLQDRRSVHYLDCRKMKGSRNARLSDIFEDLGRLFAAAEQSAPAVLVLDDLDELVPRVEGGGHSESLHLQQMNPVMVEQCRAIEGILRHLHSMSQQGGYNPMYIVTCKSSEELSQSVRQTLSTDNSLQLPILSSDDRSQLLHSFLERTQPWDDFCADCRVFVGKQTAGFRPRDLELLATRVNRLFQTEDKSTSARGLVEKALEGYTPLSRISAATEMSDLQYRLSDLGGLTQVKQALVDTIVRPARYQRIFSNAAIRLPRGVLLFGPSGCGKSFIVPALARECGYPLIMCRGPELLDRYIGASEMKVRQLFARAASVAPSILFLDELDSLAPRRGSDNTGVTDRIVNQLLTFLDGVEDASRDATVYIVASSSRPDKIDPALLRPGRLERHIYVGLPDTDAEWNNLLLRISLGYDLSPELSTVLKEGRMPQHLGVANWQGFQFTPADLSAVFNTAQLLAAHEALASDSNAEMASLRLDHLVQAFLATRPSMTQEDRTRLNSIYAAFRHEDSALAFDQIKKDSSKLRIALR